MAILKGKIKTETGDTLYPETSVDKVIGIDQASVKALYHLGEYGTVDTSNVDYDLVTRATGYVSPEEIVAKVDTAGGYSDHTRFAIYVGVATIDGAKWNYRNDVDPVRTESNGYGINSYSDGNIYMVAQNITSLSAFKAWILENGISIQYRLATPYTEKVIKNRPLNTLDQNGSMFVREEWEKGLQLWDEQWANGYYDDNTMAYIDNANVICCKYPIPVKPNTTYTITNRTTKLGIKFWTSSGTYIAYDECPANSQKTFTIPSNCAYITIATFGSDQTTSYTQGQVMLNEGSHPYPYQPYNGDIVREKDINGTLLWENANPNSAFSSQTVTTGDMSKFKYIVIAYKVLHDSTFAVLYRKVKYELNKTIYISSGIGDSSSGQVYTRNFMATSATQMIINDDLLGNNIIDTIIPVAIYGTNVL